MLIHLPNNGDVECHVEPLGPSWEASWAVLGLILGLSWAPHAEGTAEGGRGGGEADTLCSYMSTFSIFPRVWGTLRDTKGH